MSLATPVDVGVVRLCLVKREMVVVSVVDRGTFEFEVPATLGAGDEDLRAGSENAQIRC